jgi:DNA-binding CsgD family transcriptional regulator/sugar phosphate isomerase/epimerase
LAACGLWDTGHTAKGTEASLEAIEVLEAIEPGEELASAYAKAAGLAMVAADHQQALRWGGKAMALAERLGANGELAYALNIVGCSKVISGQAAGIDDLRRSITVAIEAGLDHYVSLGWMNLGSATLEVRDYATAVEALLQALDFAGEHDLDVHQQLATAWLGQVHLERGEWAEAAALTDGLPLDQPGLSRSARIAALSIRGRLHARRGDGDPEPPLERAWSLALHTGELQGLLQTAAARAEDAWLAGNAHEILKLVEETYRLACELGSAWAIGELGLWRARAGSGEALPDRAADPWALHAAGRLQEAAKSWERIGCPYEAADALADSDAPADLRAALEVFDRLGAAVPAGRVRRRLRGLGVRALPPGPRPATAANPAGLTRRQAEVLALLGLGLSDADIAARLHLSAKTVGHHVSAILDKLAAGSRGEAVHRGRQLGLPLHEGDRPAPGQLR